MEANCSRYRSEGEGRRRKGKRKNATVEESDEAGEKQDGTEARRSRLLSVAPAARQAPASPLRLQLASVSRPAGQMTPIPGGGEAAMTARLGRTVPAREIAAAGRLCLRGMHCTEGGQAVPAGGAARFKLTNWAGEGRADERGSPSSEPRLTNTGAWCLGPPCRGPPGRAPPTATIRASLGHAPVPCRRPPPIQTVRLLGRRWQSKDAPRRWGKPRWRRLAGGLWAWRAPLSAWGLAAAQRLGFRGLVSQIERFRGLDMKAVSTSTPWPEMHVGRRALPR